MSTTDIIEQADALIGRGVNKAIATELVATLGTDNVKRTITWFDQQHGRVGAGVLVAELRAGGRPGTTKPTPIECPCTPELEREWARVVAHIEQTVGADDWAMRYAPWMDRLHPHDHDEVTGWTIGAQRWVLDWFGHRQRGLVAAARCRVTLVACEHTTTEGRMR